MQSKRAKSSKLSFTAKRFLGFLKTFVRNKRAALGLGLILFFVIVAVFAPLITSFDSLGTDPSFKGFVAGKYAAPGWLRHLPTFLGGDPTLSENIEIVGDPGLPKLWADGVVFNYSSVGSGEGYVNIGFDEDVDYPHSVPGLKIDKKEGSLAVTFQRESGSVSGETKVYVFTDFYYPYSGVPGMYIGNVELLVNGSRWAEWYPEEQWFIILIDNARAEPKIGNLSIVTSSTRGLYIAASTDITEYFANTASWKKEGYKSWQEWLNGTESLRHHWDSMNWVVSEGSLINKTYEEIQYSTNPSMYDDSGNVTYYCFGNNTEMCDPDLNYTDNIPDILAEQNWTKISTTMTNETLPGQTKIYVASVKDFKKGDSIIIGMTPYEEVNVITKINVTENSFELAAPFISEHSVGEPVVVEEQRLALFQNLEIPSRQKLWILVKLVLTDPDQVYRLKTEGLLASMYDAQLNYPDTGWSGHYVSMPMQVARKIEYLQVPVKVRVFLGQKDIPMENMTTLFPKYGQAPKGFSSVATTKEVIINQPYSGDSVNGFWLLSRTSKANMLSLMQLEVKRELMNLFPFMPSVYRFGMEITFMDTIAPAENVSVTVNVDDFQLKLMGTSFGLLGTDQYARDLFSQLVYGTRISLYLGLLVAVISVVIGLSVGLASGYVGGAMDQLLMRFNDLMLVLPGLPLMIVLVAVLGARIEILIVLLGFLGWNGFARLVRSQVLSLKERPFIEAAKASGAGTTHIITKHILPNVMALVYISLATAVPGAITAEAALSWLGFYDPFRMSWGRMLREVFVAGATRSWWWIIPPGLCIAAIAVAFILLGYALDEILNPKLRLRR